MLEWLMYRILPEVLQPGFPATPSATGLGNLQPVAVNRAVSSHLDRVSLTRGQRSGLGDHEAGRMVAKYTQD